MNRVVITGLGAYSCIGKNLEEVKDSLYHGRSGIIYDPGRKNFGYRSALTGFVERPDLKGVLDRRSRMMMPEQAEFAYVSTREALAQANRGWLERIITRRVPPEQWSDALERRPDDVKTVIDFSLSRA